MSWSLIKERRQRWHYRPSKLAACVLSAAAWKKCRLWVHWKCWDMSELMDWSRFLSLVYKIRIVSKVYGFTMKPAKATGTYFQQINDTLKDNEIGILFMTEGHHVQFNPDIRYFISPRPLWMRSTLVRDYEAKAEEEAKKPPVKPEDANAESQEKSPARNLISYPRADAALSILSHFSFSAFRWTRLRTRHRWQLQALPTVSNVDHLLPRFLIGSTFNSWYLIWLASSNP